jgi:hypothetical protein
MIDDECGAVSGMRIGRGNRLSYGTANITCYGSSQTWINSLALPAESLKIFYCPFNVDMIM